MKRDYNTGTAKSVTFFVGDEVEHTPAHGLKTLFVVGVHAASKIDSVIKNYEFTSTRRFDSKTVQHIYFGANQSFPKERLTAGEWAEWLEMITPFLREGMFCTLDIDVSQVEALLETGLTEYHTFIPMISVKLPYVQQLGYNATIKLDDKGFKASNPGVWCHSVHALQDRRVFTDWGKYTQDQIIE